MSEVRVKADGKYKTYRNFLAKVGSSIFEVEGEPHQHHSPFPLIGTLKNRQYTTNGTALVRLHQDRVFNSLFITYFNFASS